MSLLYDALSRLIKEYPYQKAELFISRIKYYDPRYAAYLQTAVTFSLSDTGKLYFTVKGSPFPEYPDTIGQDHIFRLSIPPTLPF